MSFTLHIDPLSVPVDDVSGSRSEFSSLSLLARIWLWLSQIWGRESYEEAAKAVFCLGADDALNGHRFQNLISTDDLNRYRRRMLARYTRLELSLDQVKAWIKARKKARRFQTELARYYGLRFLRRAALTLSRAAQRGLGKGGLCNAPLTPD